MGSDPSTEPAEGSEVADRTHLVFGGFLVWYAVIAAGLIVFGFLAGRGFVKNAAPPRLNSPVIVAPPEGANRGQ